MGITINRLPPYEPEPEERPVVEAGRSFIRDETQWATQEEPPVSETIEKIYLDKDGNEVPAGDVRAVRQLTHDDAKRFREAHKPDEKAVKQAKNKAAAKSENK